MPRRNQRGSNNMGNRRMAKPKRRSKKDKQRRRKGSIGMSQVDPFELVELNALAIARHRLLDLPNGDELAEAIDNGTARVDLEPASAKEMSIVVNEPSTGTRTHLATAPQRPPHLQPLG